MGRRRPWFTLVRTGGEMMTAAAAQEEEQDR